MAPLLQTEHHDMKANRHSANCGQTVIVHNLQIVTAALVSATVGVGFEDLSVTTHLPVQFLRSFDSIRLLWVAYT